MKTYFFEVDRFFDGTNNLFLSFDKTLPLRSGEKGKGLYVAIKAINREYLEKSIKEKDFSKGFCLVQNPTGEEELTLVMYLTFESEADLKLGFRYMCKRKIAFTQMNHFILKAMLPDTFIDEIIMETKLSGSISYSTTSPESSKVSKNNVAKAKCFKRY